MLTVSMSLSPLAGSTVEGGNLKVCESEGDEGIGWIYVMSLRPLFPQVHWTSFYCEIEKVYSSLHNFVKTEIYIFCPIWRWQ
jgi:hypothetical protein